MVRELDMSRITLRLVERASKEDEKDESHVLAKLTGQTIDILRRSLVSLVHIKAKALHTDSK